MELLVIGLFVAGAALLAKRKAAPASSSQSPTASSGAQSPDGSLAAIAKVPAVGAVVAATAGAVLVGTQLGKKVDKAISGGDTTKLTQTGGAIAGGAIVGGAVAVAGGAVVAFSLFGGMAAVLAFGAIAGPLYGVLIAAAVVTYALILWMNDLEALAYGQAGATRDYWKQWQDIHDRAIHAVSASSDFQGYSPTEIEMVVTPFVDGYMEQLNEIAFLTWWHKGKGITEAGLDTQGHLQHGRDRGKFVGDVANWKTAPSEVATLVPTIQSKWLQYTDSNWIGENMPMGTFTVSTKTSTIPGQPVVRAGHVVSQGTARKVTVTTNSLDPTVLDGMKRAYAKGRLFANIIRYRDYMVKNPDGIADPVKRVASGLRGEFFEGTQGTGAPGNLVWAGQEFNYQALEDQLN